MKAVALTARQMPAGAGARKRAGKSEKTREKDRFYLW
jgi:hypothetical protein